MFSKNASAISNLFLSILQLIAIFMIATPQITEAQNGESTDDPPPIWYRPDTSGDGQSNIQTFICRTSLEDTLGDLSCAAEIKFGENVRLSETSRSTTFTFALENHETISLETVGDLKTSGELLDARGRRIASGDGSASNHNFRITRTLRPGRYFLNVIPAVDTAGFEGFSAVRISEAIPVHQRSARPIEIGRDVGNHCGRATLSAWGTTEGRFDRPGDIDVYTVEVAGDAELLIDVAGDARYELKAADCSTSLGVTRSSLGATLASLQEGTYFLYVSQSADETGTYDLRLELR